MEYELLIDRETGECVDLPEIELESSRVPDVPVSNAETGEPEINVSPKSQRRRVPFQVIINLLCILFKDILYHKESY